VSTERRKRTVGVTVGKFNPPHLGHAHLVSVAADQVDHLYVILGDHPDQTIAASRRAEWLVDAAPPNVTVLITPDDLPAANEPWARRALEILPEAPSVAFTSEAWGPGWAAEMGADHVSVDLGRERFPISGRTIRSDLRGNFHWLVPAGRAALARRVVLAGAESTGKTTLAQGLAARYATVWVPEYGRWYWQGRRHLADQSWDQDEFRRIAATHHQMEADLARMAGGGLVVLDTDALVTTVWQRRYGGTSGAFLDEFAGQHKPDLYLICAPDFAWKQDGTRQSADHRLRMHDHTVELVERTDVPFEILTGDHSARMARASDLIDRLTDFEELA